VQLSDTLEVCGWRAFGRSSAFADAPSPTAEAVDRRGAPPSHDFNRRLSWGCTHRFRFGILLLTFEMDFVSCEQP